MNYPADPQTFARLSRRLQTKPDRSDRGQTLPRTAAALDEKEKAKRQAAVVEALGAERLIVPVPVEAHPNESGRHGSQELGEDDEIPLRSADTPAGPAIAVFSSAEALAAWDPEARPMVMHSQKAALTALAVGIPRLVLDVAGPAVLIPRPATEALATGDTWLPAWEDQALRETLERKAREGSAWADYIGVRLLPTEGGITVQVRVAARSDEKLRGRVAKLLADLGREPRLAGSAETIEFQPVLLPST